MVWVYFFKSKTVLMGWKVVRGTSTKRVIQCAMAPFQSPGSSIAFKGRPSYDLEEMKPVSESTYCIRSNLSPSKVRVPHTMSTGLKWVDFIIISFCCGFCWLIWEDSTICREVFPWLLRTQKGPPPGSPSFFTMPQTRNGRLRAEKISSREGCSLSKWTPNFSFANCSISVCFSKLIFGERKSLRESKVRCLVKLQLT